MIKFLISFCGMLILTGCTKTNTSSSEHKDQVSAYQSILKPVHSANPNIQVSRYLNPSFDRSKYYGVILEPMTISNNGNANLNSKQLDEAQANIEKDYREMVEKKYHITNDPANGVVTVKTVIAISQNQTTIEVQINDSRSDVLLGDALTIIQDDALGKNYAIFENTTKEYVKTTSKYAAGFFESSPGVKN